MSIQDKFLAILREYFGKWYKVYTSTGYTTMYFTVLALNKKDADRVGRKEIKIQNKKSKGSNKKQRCHSAQSRLAKRKNKVNAFILTLGRSDEEGLAQDGHSESVARGSSGGGGPQDAGLLTEDVVSARVHVHRALAIVVCWMYNMMSFGVVYMMDDG